MKRLSPPTVMPLNASNDVGPGGGGGGTAALDDVDDDDDDGGDDEGDVKEYEDGAAAAAAASFRSSALSSSRVVVLGADAVAEDLDGDASATMSTRPLLSRRWIMSLFSKHPYVGR